MTGRWTTLGAAARTVRRGALAVKAPEPPNSETV